MPRKPIAKSPVPVGARELPTNGESGLPASSRSPHFRKLFFLALIFLYIPFAYNYGVKLRLITFVDLSSFYYAAQTVFVHHQSPYTPGALAWGARATHLPVWPYLYPPPTLLLFSPFAHLSYKTVELLVLAANHLCILGLLYLLLNLLGFTNLFSRRVRQDQALAKESGRRELTALFLLVYFFLFQPIIITLFMGQINFFVIVLLCLTWYGMKEKATPALSALPLALAVVLKTYPILFLPILMIKGRWRMAGWTLCFLTLITLASYVVLPRALWQDWLTYVLPYGGYTKTPPGLFSPARVWNQSLNGFCSRIFLDPHTALLLSPVAARISAYFLSAILIGTEITLTWRLRLVCKDIQRDRFLDLEFGLFLLTMYLVAPLSWEHHLVFVLPALFIALTRIFSYQESVGMTLWVAIAAFMIAWPVPLEEAGWGRYCFHLLLSLKFYAVFALWLYFALWLAQLTQGIRQTILQERKSRSHAAFD